MRASMSCRSATAAGADRASACRRPRTAPRPPGAAAAGAARPGWRPECRREHRPPAWRELVRDGRTRRVALDGELEQAARGARLQVAVELDGDGPRLVLKDVTDGQPCALAAETQRAHRQDADQLRPFAGLELENEAVSHDSAMSVDDADQIHTRQRRIHHLSVTPRARRRDRVEHVFVITAPEAEGRNGDAQAAHIAGELRRRREPDIGLPVTQHGDHAPQPGGLPLAATPRPRAGSSMTGHARPASWRRSDLGPPRRAASGRRPRGPAARR